MNTVVGDDDREGLSTRWWETAIKTLSALKWALEKCRGSGVAGVTGVHWRASLTGVH